ncbi:MAG TPA: hypothetical protein VJ844_04100 [Mucilaginibacter sp.]|nr:hypothetical protein [Mucilaginibacter sp.]
MVPYALKKLPDPLRILVGDLTDPAKVVAGLDMLHQAGPIKSHQSGTRTERALKKLEACYKPIRHRPRRKRNKPRRHPISVRIKEFRYNIWSDHLIGLTLLLCALADGKRRFMLSGYVSCAIPC